MSNSEQKLKMKEPRPSLMKGIDLSLSNALLKLSQTEKYNKMAQQELRLKGKLEENVWIWKACDHCE